MKGREIHNSHLMTEWRTETRGCETPHFCSTRNCTQCEREEVKHPTGHFTDEWLYDPCVPDEEAK